MMLVKEKTIQITNGDIHTFEVQVYESLNELVAEHGEDWILREMNKIIERNITMVQRKVKMKGYF